MGHPKVSATTPPDQQGHISDPAWKAPRLSKALIQAEAGKNVWFQTDLEKAMKSGTQPLLTLSDPAQFDNELLLLCQHMQQRIDNTLTEAWLSTEGYDIESEIEMAFTPGFDFAAHTVEFQDLVQAIAFYMSDEEAWARTFAEMTVFSMYFSPGGMYGYGTNHDEAVFDFFPGHYSIGMACQNLSSYAILSRGFKTADIKSGAVFGCGCTAGTVDYPAFNHNKSVKKPPKTSTTDQDKLLIEGNQGLNLGKPAWATSAGLVGLGVTPGSVVVFNPGGSKYNKQDVTAGTGRATHVASILRVSGQRVQFIDTGVETGDDESSVEAGTVDHSFLGANRDLVSADTAVAVGVLLPSANLVDSTTKTALSKPLGVARLFIADGTTKEVRFISKLVHMRYPVSKLVWSLKGLPTNGLIVGWLTYATNTQEATQALASAGTAAPENILTGKAPLYPLPANILMGRNPADRLSDPVVPIAVYRFHNTNVYRFNLSAGNVSTSAAELAPAVAWPLQIPGGNTVNLWATKTANFGKRFVRLPGNKQGSVDSGIVGSALVDP